MGEQEIARAYAMAQGLEFLGKGMLPASAPSLPGRAACVSVVRGRIAGLAEGLVFQTMRASPDATRGLPGAQFEIACLGDSVEWVWARRSGRSLWTRVKLPRHLAEVTLESEPLMARYRIRCDIARDGRFVRLLFDDVFAGWLRGARAAGGGCERDRNELRDLARDIVRRGATRFVSGSGEADGVRGRSGPDRRLCADGRQRSPTELAAGRSADAFERIPAGATVAISTTSGIGLPRPLRQGR